MNRFSPWFVRFGIFSVLLLSASLSGCLGSSFPDKPLWPAADLDWPMDHTGTRTVRLHVPPGFSMNAAADAMEKIVYPNGRPQDPHNVRRDLLLQTLWPGMGPRTVANDKEFEVPGGGRVLMIYLGSGAVDPAIHARDQLHVNLDVDVSFLKHVCIPPPSLPGEAMCHDLKELAEKPSRFGLKHMGVDFGQFPDVSKELYHEYDDIYYVPEVGGGLQTYIKCTADEVGATVNGYQYIPHCDQHFIFKPLNAWVNVNYRRIYLEDWQKIQAAVEKLLQSFITKQ